MSCITVPQAKLPVQLDISYQTLKDICCASCTDTDFGKALVDSSRKPTSLKEAHCSNPNLRLRGSVFKPHLLLYLYFITDRLFHNTSTEIPAFRRDIYRPWDSGSLQKLLTNVRVDIYLLARESLDMPRSRVCTYVCALVWPWCCYKCSLISNQRRKSHTSIKLRSFHLIILVFGR